jgi:hypothetical protein
MEEVPLSDDEGDIIVLVSEASSSTEPHNKRRKRDDRLDAVVRQYDFMHDDIEEVGNSDEEANESFVEADDVDARNLMLEHGLVNDEREDLRVAFAVLATGDWEAFLDTHVINNKFKPAFSLLEFFGIGKGTKNVKHLWRLLWESKLVISPSKSNYSGKCIACVYERCLGYVSSERKLAREEPVIVPIGLMGPRCYEIRFSTLRNLVDHCLILTSSVQDANFDGLVDQCLRQDLDEIISANEIMEEAHQYLEK